jgi:hypothetical protein
MKLRPPAGKRGDVTKKHPRHAFEQRRLEMARREEVALLFRAHLKPMRTHAEVAKILCLSRQAVAQAERVIFFKIAMRMKDPFFNPRRHHANQ